MIEDETLNLYVYAKKIELQNVIYFSAEDHDWITQYEKAYLWQVCNRTQDLLHF